jgi:hypothetical protein
MAVNVVLTVKSASPVILVVPSAFKAANTANEAWALAFILSPGTLNAALAEIALSMPLVRVAVIDIEAVVDIAIVALALTAVTTNSLNMLSVAIEANLTLTLTADNALDALNAALP